MPDLSDAEALGRGIRFDTDWDVETVGGSFDLVDGVPLLARDLAWQLSQRLDDEVRGQTLDAGSRERVKATINTIATESSRIDRVVPPIDVEQADTDPRRVAVTVELVAVTGSRGEFILSA